MEYSREIDINLELHKITIEIKKKQLKTLIESRYRHFECFCRYNLFVILLFFGFVQAKKVAVFIARAKTEMAIIELTEELKVSWNMFICVGLTQFIFKLKTIVECFMFK